LRYTGEQTLGERAVDDDLHPDGSRRRENLALDGAPQQIVGKLVGDRGDRRTALDEFGQLRHLPRPEIADGAGADLPGGLQLGECAESVGERHIEIGPMDVVNVDVVGLEAPKTGVEGLRHRLRPQAFPIGFRRNRRLVVASLQSAADDLLRPAVAVSLGGVEKVDAVIEGRCDGAGGRPLILRPPEARVAHRQVPSAMRDTLIPGSPSVTQSIHPSQSSPRGRASTIARASRAWTACHDFVDHG